MRIEQRLEARPQQQPHAVKKGIEHTDAPPPHRRLVRLHTTHHQQHRQRVAAAKQVVLHTLETHGDGAREYAVEERFERGAAPHPEEVVCEQVLGRGAVRKVLDERAQQLFIAVPCACRVRQVQEDRWLVTVLQHRQARS